MKQVLGIVVVFVTRIVVVTSSKYGTSLLFNFCFLFLFSFFF